jgi:hypothetical protein
MNAYLYFMFPFVIHLIEPHVHNVNFYIIPYYLSYVIFGIIMHVFLIIMVIVRYSWLYGLLYVGAYFIFLLPILVIPSLGAHYLYGSAIAMSFALAFLLDNWRSHALQGLTIIGLVIVLMLHAVTFQNFIYEVGACQQRLVASLETLALTLGDEKLKKGIYIVPEPASPAHVLLRSIQTRDKFNYAHIINDSTKTEQNGYVARFNNDCYFYFSPISTGVR